jgi:hypothetical protein
MSDIQYDKLTFGELLSLVKHAAFNGELHFLCEILSIVHNPQDFRGLAVACAATKGHLIIIQELLKNGATISQEYRGQAVINAALEGYHRVIYELLKNKAEITLEDWKYALRCAVENEHLDSVHELAENVPLESDLLRCWPKRKDDFL